MIKKLLALPAILVLGLIALNYFLNRGNTQLVPTVRTTRPVFLIKTDKGDIKVSLYGDVAPKTVENFYSKTSIRFYDGLIFHRVEDWVIQGGDPLGNGTGGGTMSTEISQKPFKEGSVGVARGGDINISNDSQFFICTVDCSWLTGQYTNFGEVIEGMSVAKSIAVGDKIKDVLVLEY